LKLKEAELLIVQERELHSLMLLREKNKEIKRQEKETQLLKDSEKELQS